MNKHLPRVLFPRWILIPVRTVSHVLKLMLHLKNTTQFFRMGSKAIKLWHQNGFKALISKLSEEAIKQYHYRDQYPHWIRMYDTLSDEDRDRIRKKTAIMPVTPLISVLMPVYNTPEQWLRKAIESVRNQLYQNWELCIADDHSTEPHIKTILEEYRKLDLRIKVTYRNHNGHISAASNSGLEMATGEFVALLDHDDELAEHALYLVAEEINAHPDVNLIYSDEDKVDENGRRYDPYFKSDWNPELFYSHNMICHLGVYRTRLVRELSGFRPAFEGSQDYDLALRVTEHSSEEKIRHIPHVLYHWRNIQGSAARSPHEKNYAIVNGRKALEEHFQRMGMRVHVLPTMGCYQRIVYPLPESFPKVSLIVCTRDQYELLHKLIDGILEKTDYANLELIIVDNQSTKKETLDYFKRLEKDPRVRLIKYNAPFNFSAMNNLAVQKAQGEIIVLINNDIEIIHENWLKEIVSHATRPAIGVVGVMLYYPDNTIQHAGVIIGLGGIAGHAHKDFVRDAYGYFGRARLAQNFSAVTAACMAVRKNVYQEVSGLDEENLKIAFNDIDFCLKVLKKGYRNIWTPFAELYHVESASRKSDSARKQRKRFHHEIQFMKNKWGTWIDSDPYYNPNLTLAKEDFSLAFPPRVSKPWINL